MKAQDTCKVGIFWCTGTHLSEMTLLMPPNYSHRWHQLHLNPVISAWQKSALITELMPASLMQNARYLSYR